MHFSGAFFWIVMFRFKVANRSLSSLNWNFKSLILVKFQAPTLDQRHHLLVKLSCQSVCETLDAISAWSAVCLLQPILQLSKKSSMPPLSLHFCYVCTPADAYQHTFNRSRVATLLYSKTTTPEVGLQILRTYKTCILSNSWATSWRMQLIT